MQTRMGKGMDAIVCERGKMWKDGGMVSGSGTEVGGAMD